MMTKNNISSNLAKYKTKNPVKKILLDRFLSKIESNLVEINPKTILDAGCGEGLVLKMLDKKLRFKRAYGIDISKEALKRAKNNVRKGVFVKKSVLNTGFKKGKFDVVIMLEVLEHLDDPKLAIVEAKRVSKKWCVFSVPNEPAFSILSLLSGMYVNRLGRHPEHVNFWTKRKMHNLLKGYFEEVRYVSSFPWLVFLCKK